MGSGRCRDGHGIVLIYIKIKKNEITIKENGSKQFWSENHVT